MIFPDFAYFNHSIHINKGVGCNTCHGPVDRMPLMYNYASLQMEWCLDCHRASGKISPAARPGFQYALRGTIRQQAGRGGWQGIHRPAALGTDLVKKYKLRTVTDITSCSTCHR